MRDEEEGVLEEQQRASVAAGVNTAILLSGYIVIATDQGLISFFDPVARTTVHTAQLPLPAGNGGPAPKPSHLQQMGGNALLVGLSYLTLSLSLSLTLTLALTRAI